MQQPTSKAPASDLSETHARLTLALGTALGPLVAFLDDPLVVEIMLSADGAIWVERRGTGMQRTEARMEPVAAEAMLRLVAADAGVELTSKGGKPLLGLMQVPPSWMKMFGREPRDAFDACINVSIGTAMLSALDHECAVGSGPRLEPVGRRSRRLPVMVVLPPDRACVVRKYGQAIGMPDFELLITLELGGQRPVPRTVAPTDAPIVFPEPNERTWGPDCIFVPVADEASLRR